MTEKSNSIEIYDHSDLKPLRVFLPSFPKKKNKQTNSPKDTVVKSRAPHELDELAILSYRIARVKTRRWNLPPPDALDTFLALTTRRHSNTSNREL